MPIFLAYTAAKALKCSPVIAMVLGGFLCHPTIDALIQDVGSKSTIFGLPVVKQAFTIGESTKVFSYTESVIPIILLVIVLAFLERGLKKIIPEILQIILVPGISLIVMIPIALVVLDRWESMLVLVFSGCIRLFIPSVPCWAVLSSVVCGVYVLSLVHTVHCCPSVLTMWQYSGTNTLMCFAGSANFAQAGAALGVTLKSKSAETKQVAGAGALSAFLVGVTEPAIRCQPASETSHDMCGDCRCAGRCCYGYRKCGKYRICQ